MRQRGDATPTTLFAAPPPTSLAAARTPANTAATLLPSCEVPVAGAATGRGGEALSAPRHGFPRRLAADQRAALASPRRDQGWTVIHLPSTLGGCGPFDSQPMVEIKRGRPNTNGTLTALSTQIALSLSCPATSPASPPPPASTDPALD